MAHGHVGYTLWRDEAEQVRGEKVFSKQTAWRSVTWMPLCLDGQQSFFCSLQHNRASLLWSLLYVELLALDGPSVRETSQCLTDGPELLLPLLKLSVVFKVCGGWQGESIPDPNHKGKQDQRHDPLGPWRTHSLQEVKRKIRSSILQCWGCSYIIFITWQSFPKMIDQILVHKMSLKPKMTPLNVWICLLTQITSNMMFTQLLV